MTRYKPVWKEEVHAADTLIVTPELGLHELPQRDLCAFARMFGTRLWGRHQIGQKYQLTTAGSVCMIRLRTELARRNLPTLEQLTEQHYANVDATARVAV